MRYTISFNLRGKENTIFVDYEKTPNAKNQVLLH